MSMIRVLAIIVIALLLVNIFMPVVQATETQSGKSRSGKVVNVNETVSILPSDDFDYTTLMNIANNSDLWLCNYNQTIKPFMDDNPDITGIMVYPYFAPLLLNASFTDRNISVAGFIRMEPSTIMDGISEFWIRVPVFNLSDEVTITLRILRILAPINFNATMTGIGVTEYDTDYNQEIYNATYEPDADLVVGNDDPIPNGYNGLVLQDSVDHDAWENQWWNTTWVNVPCGLFPNENYYIQFDIVWPDDDGSGELQLALSQEDFCADNNYNAWFYVNGTGYHLDADFDMSMIMTFGMSNGITGLGVDTDYYEEPDGAPAGTEYYHLNSTIPFKQEIEEDYFETVIPILWDETECITDYTNITFQISMYSSEDETVCFASETFYKNINSTYSYVVHDMDISAYSGEYLDHIRLSFRTGILYSQSFKLWAHQYIMENKTGYTDSYFSIEGGVQTGYYIYNKAYFIPYGYYGQSESYWNQTQFNLILIPIETPSTPNDIVEAIHRFQMYMEDEDGNRKLITIQEIGELLFEALSYAVTKLIDTIITWTAFVLGAIIDFFFGEGTADWLWNALIGIGQWIWDTLNMLIDAFEWFVYWTVRTIYSLSIVIIYMLNVFGVISINSALLAYAKTGKGRDFVKGFKQGWNMVWGIISLLISALILAVGIIGAVVPF